eukprot:9501125-Pyramimonas_sp.AAC.1
MDWLLLIKRDACFPHTTAACNQLGMLTFGQREGGGWSSSISADHGIGDYRRVGDTLPCSQDRPVY